MLRLLWATFPLFLLLTSTAGAETTGSLSVHLLAPGGTAVTDAELRLENRTTGFARDLKAGADNIFTLENLPPGLYRLTCISPGFRPELRQVNLRTGVPLTLDIALELASVQDTVTVSGSESSDLVDPEATGTRTALSSAAMDKMPAPAASRGIEAYLLTFPGFAMNANGAIHPRGAHNQITFVIDGMPISDQLTGAFATALDPALVDSLELYTGDVPAEFGSKVSGVAAISTRSAAGSGRRLFGNTQISAAQFDTLQNVTQAGGESGRFAWFASISTVKTHRFLDQVSFDNLHNGGNTERGFLRLDWQAGARDTLHFNAMAGRSSFELANLRSQQAVGMDQRQLLRDLSVWVRWNRLLSPSSTWESTIAYRPTVAYLFPSAADIPVSASQARHLTTVTFANRFNRIAGPHTIRGGIDVQHFPVSENFFLFLDPANPFLFSKRRSGSLYSVFLQDSIHWQRFVLSLGLRYDNYRFLVQGNQLQPRIGVAYNLKETGTVLRASYNRNFQTPPNENLLLSSSEEATRLATSSGRSDLRAQRENVYEAGLQQSLFGKATLNASFYHKDSRDQQDNNNFLNTGVIFPVALARIRVNGVEGRIVLPAFHRVTTTVSATHARAISTPPFTGGLFIGQDAINLLTSGPFVIDHDQKLSLQTTATYDIRWNWWTTASIRYDSGLVANPTTPQKLAADPDYADLVPYMNFNTDPVRVARRTISDLALGYRHMSGDRRAWDLQIQVNNAFGVKALYNCQSVFVGTRVVAPRSAGVKLRWHW